MNDDADNDGLEENDDGTIESSSPPGPLPMALRFFSCSPPPPPPMTRRVGACRFLDPPPLDLADKQVRECDDKL